MRRYWNPLSLTQLIGRKLVGKFATETLAVDRVDARPLVRPSTVDQSLSSRSLDDPRSLTPATRGVCIWCGLIPRLVFA